MPLGVERDAHQSKQICQPLLSPIHQATAAYCQMLTEWMVCHAPRYESVIMTVTSSYLLITMSRDDKVFA